MTDSDRQIGFEQVGIASVLSRHTLIVPPNQRDYSWTEREVRGLLTDVARAMQAPGSPDYFLGSIVTIPVRLGVLEVVDGQQRLATTAILLAAIRDFLGGRESDKLIVEHINTFLTTIDPRARVRVSRLRLNTTDSNFFERRVLEGDHQAVPAAQSHRLLVDAATQVRAYIDSLARSFEAKDQGDMLNNWVEFLEHRAVVILLKVPGAVNAYRMFETLNDRGLRTSQADLVKNYLFGESADRLPEAQHKWSSMKAVLESLGYEDITINFLRQMLISLFGHITDTEVYETVQENARGATATIAFLAQLEAGASDYVALLNPDHERWNRYPPSARRALQALAPLRIKPIRPVMLSIARIFGEAEADSAFRYLLNLAVRLMICGGGRSGHVEESLAAVAKSISDKKTLTARDLAGLLSNIAPTDAAFEEEFKVAKVSQAFLARYYLRCLEMQSNQMPFPYFIPNDDHKVINLEHVLPEKPLGNWPTFTTDEADSLYRRLGNMALLDAKENSNLGSAPFEEKKKVYAGCGFSLTSQLAAVGDWNTETIAARQEKLAALAVKTWPIKV